MKDTPSGRERDWFAVLQSKSGRRVLSEIFEMTGYFHILPREGIEYAAGAHNVGAKLFYNITDLDVTFLNTMLKEKSDGIYDD